jgi:hypothetical protein
MSQPLFHISAIAMVFFGLSTMVDRGTAADITIEDIKSHAKAGTLGEFLKERNGGSFATNYLDGNPAFAKWYFDQIRDQCVAMDGRELRKYGVEHNGIALLISYTAEILQSGDMASVSMKLPT